MASPAANRRYRMINSSRHCAAEGCDKFRRRASRYCVLHEKHVRLYGATGAGRIPEATLEEYRFKFSAFIDRHSETPQVRAAVQLCGDLIQHGLPQELPKWRVKQLTRYRGDVDKRLLDLKALHVTGREILDAAGGVWLLSRSDPRILPDDVRLTYRLGLEVLKTRPFPHKITTHGNDRIDVPKGLPRKAIGDYLRRHLGVFFTRVVEGLDAEVQAVIDREKMLATKFDPTPDATTSIVTTNHEGSTP